MEGFISKENTFANRNMCQTFYPNKGEIKTNTNKSFKIKKALVVKKKPIEESFPFHIYFDDLRINPGQRTHRSRGTHFCQSKD